MYVHQLKIMYTWYHRKIIHLSVRAVRLCGKKSVILVSFCSGAVSVYKHSLTSFVLIFLSFLHQQQGDHDHCGAGNETTAGTGVVYTVGSGVAYTAGLEYTGVATQDGHHCGGYHTYVLSGRTGATYCGVEGVFDFLLERRHSRGPGAGTAGGVVSVTGRPVQKPRSHDVGLSNGVAQGGM